MEAKRWCIPIARTGLSIKRGKELLLLAIFGPVRPHRRCPLLKARRTIRLPAVISQSDPYATSNGCRPPAIELSSRRFQCGNLTRNSPCFSTSGGWAMKCSKRSFAVSVLFALLLLFGTATLNARDSDFESLIFATAQTANHQCINTCRARYRDCRSLKQIPFAECRGIYQDCTRFTCGTGPVGSSWPGFPR